MKRIKGILFLLIVCPVVLLLFVPMYASEVTPIGRYHFEPDPDLPKTLYVGRTLECGDYSIMLLQQPVIGKYSLKLIADNDLEYLMVRVAITNNSEETRGWLNADSFKIMELYKGLIYSTYDLDIPVSAKSSEKFGQKAYFDKIDPGDTIYTTLVFSVYPDVDGWILRFSPRVFYEESPAETISFRLPKVLHYSEGN